METDKMENISKELKLLNRKRNLKKGSINNKISVIKKQDLYTFEELKEKGEKKLNISTTLEELKNSIKIFDVDEKMNLEYLNKLENLNGEEAFNEFKKYMYSLQYEKRVEFINNHKTQILEIQKKYVPSFVFCQEIQLEKLFFELLKFILDEGGKDLSTIYTAFCTNFFIEALEFNIPLIYGNEELFYSYLINSFYNFFIINSEYPKIISANKEMNPNYIKIKKRKTSMIKKVKITEENPDNYEEDNLINDEDLSNERLVFSEKEQVKYKMKYSLMKEIFSKYISEEFQENFKFFLESIKDEKEKKRFKYFFLSIFEVYQNIILKSDKPIETNEEENYANFFYENKAIKLECLKEIKKMFQFKFYQLDNKEIDLENFNMKNTDYYIEINDQKYKINFFNFIVKKFKSDLIKIKGEKYERALDNIENYSLQGTIINNRCFNSKELFELFKNDLNQTLKGTTLKEAFYTIIPFRRFNYPFEKNKFIEQLNGLILYIPFLTKNILGLSLRNLGIIIINRNIFSFNDSNNIKKGFSYALLKSGFGKITFLHESNFHFSLKICASQDEGLICKTPIKYYKNYEFKKGEKKNSINYDGGDFGEALIFGEKIYELYLPGIEKIFDINFWNQQNINFAKLGTNFILLNKNDKSYKKDLKDFSNFTKSLYENIKEEIKTYFEKIDNTPVKNLGNLFVRMRNTDKDFMNENFKIGELSLRINRISDDVVEHNFKRIPGGNHIIKNK